MKRKQVILAVAGVAVLSVAGVCIASNQPVIKEESKENMVLGDTALKPAYKKISASDAKNMMDGGQQYILLDVRTEEEFDAEHLEGARLIPDYEIQDRVEVEIPDKESAILVYCRTGGRSSKAARQLLEMGYVNVYDLGGIVDWPYDTVSQDAK